MTFLRFCKYVLCSLLLIHSIHGMPYPYHHNKSQGSDMVQTIAAVGIIAAATYGVYKFCQWLFSKTDEQILHEARVCYEQALSATGTGIEVIHEGVGEFPESRKEQHNIIRNMSEDFLYQSAIAKLYSYSHSFVKHEQEVAYAVCMVQDRIAKIHEKALHCPILKELKEMHSDLSHLRFELAFCRDFLKEHTAYYELFELEAHAMGTYEFEINAVDSYADNPPYLREAMRMAVMKKASHNRISYPFMAYIEMLERDMKNLESHMKNLPSRYHNRFKGAQRLLQKLDTAYNIVVSEDAYRQELRDYKKEMLERERIAAEQAKAHAAHLQAQALQQQAYEMHKQNKLQQQQNNILAAQQPAHVHVYM